MATTASGLTIPGSSPTTTAATPIQDHWNNLGKSLNGRIVVPVASVTARATLVSALTAEGYTISASNPLIVFRADATPGCEIEYTVNGTTWVLVYDPKKNVTQHGSSVVLLNSVGNQFIAFPVSFAAIPHVVAMNGDYSNGPTDVLSLFGRPLVTGFNIHSTIAAAATRRIDWIAVGDLA